MIAVVKGVLKESLLLFNEMSPYLLIGFFFAGLLHVFIRIQTIAKHLGKNNFSSLIKAVVLGIPLPLCSCGVIPTGVLLRKSGASKGSTISFLIATPITGVDSILATYSLMGLPFAIYRVVASSVTAITAGLIANLVFLKEKFVKSDQPKEEACPHCYPEGDNGNGDNNRRGKVYGLFHYGFIKSVGDIWKWLLLGTIIGGVIAYVIPDTFIQKYLASSWLSMIVMLIVGIPMYICSTGSIPIAASLMLKGMSPGAALVFLLAGPATNTVTVTVVAKELGKRAAVIYIGVIAAMSILLGMLLNVLIEWFDFVNIVKHMHDEILPSWLHLSSTIIMGILICAALIREIDGLRKN